MTRFAGALVCLLAAASSVSEALRIPESLKDVAKQETMRIPSLRKKEVERKNKLENQIRKMAVTDANTLRQLSNNYGNNYQQNNGNNNNNNNYQNNGNGYNNGYGYNNYNWDQYMDQQGIGFDITSYSIKYTQCATVQTYSDELAEDMYTDTVLAAQRFALFRLCPQDQCSDGASMGCGSNYGEYIVSLDQFLLSMLEYQESRVAGYCEYCQNCAAIESAKHFWKQVYNMRDYALETAEESYQSWYTSYLETYSQNYNNNNNQNNANGNYQNANNQNNYDSNLAAQRYYQNIRNSNNYANQYAQNNYQQYNNNNNGNGSGNSYGYQQSATQYKWTNQDMWQFQNSQNRQYSNQASWASMGSPSGDFFGKPILNGYYDDDGQFTKLYGYFNYQGQYVSLEDDEIEWDEELFGEEPDGWADVTLDTESCSYAYAGSCYNQYDSCMQILQDQDYEDYQAQVQSSSNGQYSEYQYEQAREQYSNRATLKDFLGCVEVDPNSAYGQNDYGNYQYAQMNGYQQQNYKYAQQNQYNCYDGDEACEQQREYNEQMWEYNQKMYENRRYFIGTHCGSNSNEIKLAVYSDQFCSVLDESTDVATLLGYQPNTESIDLFPSECMPCMHDEDESQPWYEEEETYMLEPMCSMLYQFAGKCNRHLQATEYNNYNSYNANANSNSNYNSYSNYNYNKNNNQNYDADGEEESGASQDEEAEAEENANGNNYNSNRNRYYNQYSNEEWKQMYQSEAQAANEEAVCSFIDSLASNTYNENGEITITGSPWARATNFNREFVAESKAMNPGLKAGLIITMFAAVGMAVAACFLQGALSRKNVPTWKSPAGMPPRRSKGDDPTDLARQNSGITMGRSRSGMGSAPLI